MHREFRGDKEGLRCSALWEVNIHEPWKNFRDNDKRAKQFSKHFHGSLGTFATQNRTHRTARKTVRRPPRLCQQLLCRGDGDGARLSGAPRKATEVTDTMLRLDQTNTELKRATNSYGGFCGFQNDRVASTFLSVCRVLCSLCNSVTAQTHGFLAPPATDKQSLQSTALYTTLTRPSVRPTTHRHSTIEHGEQRG